MTQTVEKTVENVKNQTEGMFKQASETFKSAMDTGIRFQQDAFKCMSEYVGRGETFEDARCRMETVAADSINLIRKNAEQAQKAFDEGCKNGIELIRKAFDSGNGHGTKDMMTYARDVWQNAFDAMRGNIETASRTSTVCIENWSTFFTRSMNFGEKKAGK
ncbi:MAG: hypothetical protein DCC65_17895 [Planctomycetota bacterium]|nr:MAG: hypothetical protein DCC65_17895 [Planctomycetota bacterium]